MDVLQTQSLGAPHLDQGLPSGLNSLKDFAEPVLIAAPKEQILIDPQVLAACRSGASGKTINEISARYLNSNGTAYAQQIRELAQQVGPPTFNCELSICIPVAAHQEGHYIHRCLQSFLRQTAPTDSFEIVLLLNRPARADGSPAIACDQTPAEIMRFKAEHPEIRLRAMTAVFAEEHLNIGTIRGVLHDAVLASLEMRSYRALDHLMVRFDADADGVSRNYVRAILGYFRDLPEQLVLRGPIWTAPVEVTQDPLLNLSSALHYEVLKQLTVEGRDVLGGPNATFRASSYALLGGFDHCLDCGEDANLDVRLGQYSRLAGATAPLSTTAEDLTVYTSARRTQAVLAFDQPLSSQWRNAETQFSCGVADAARTGDLRKSSLRSSELNAQEELELRGNYMISRFTDDLIEYLGIAHQKAILLISRSMQLLQLDHSITDAGIVELKSGESLEKWHSQQVSRQLRDWHRNVLGL